MSVVQRKPPTGKPRLLDLFCGGGGCTKGYQRAGFYVVGVDIKEQPNYCGDEFHQDDALDVLRVALGGRPGGWALEFDVIHASAPCQGYAKLGGDHPRLIPEVRELLDATGLPYVIENIEDAREDMHHPVMICGTMFDPPLDVKRHRLFETNWGLEPPMWPCRHRIGAPRFKVYDHGREYLSRFVPVYGEGGGKAREHWPAAMEIDWMSDDELKEAIPPRYTEFIGAQLMAHVESRVAA